MVFALLLLLAAVGVAHAQEDAFCSDEKQVCTVGGETRTADEYPLIDTGHEGGQVCIIYFYSETCPHCQALKPFLEGIEQEYAGRIALNRLDVAEIENYNLYNDLCTAKRYAGGTIPLVMIGDEFLVGEDRIRQGLAERIVRWLGEDERICPLESIGTTCEVIADADEAVPGLGTGLVWYKTLPAVVISGLGDGINPCAFAVLIFMMTLLLEVSGNRRRLIRIGTGYITAFVLTNTLLGVLVYWFSDLLFKGSRVPFLIAAGIAVVAGLINIKDFFWYGKGISLKIPDRAHTVVQKYIILATVPASVVVGVLMAFFEAPCSASIYYAILEMLRKHTASLASALPYIILYNIVFVLPLVVLFLIIYSTGEAKRLEGWRQAKRSWMRLIMGIILLTLGVLMLSGII